MSEYGLKIKNIEAGSLYGYNLGVRDNFDYTDAMFTNSLFSDFLKENGLQIWHEKSTRDIICIEFNYGSRSYDEEKSHLEKLLQTTKDTEVDKKFTVEKKENKLNKIKELIEFTEEHKDKFDKKSAGEIRTIFYQDGVSVKYITYNKKGKVIKEEVIKYKMLYRTPGKAKKGSCMFINEELYDMARDFLYMGIKLPYENSPIVEMGAYSSLITSSIVGKVKIKPESILVLQDVDAFFNTNVVSVETDKAKHCVAKRIENYKLKNTLFDGQALIDGSIFPEWGEGYILLRHHLCKMAAFSSNIQLFFKDHFGDDYENAYVTDMWGNKILAKNIKLITTDNAMKWLKFDVSYEYWSQKVHENDCMFGIVKTAHRSKLGEVQRMSYQMNNALDMDIMEEAVKPSVEYINKLKTNNDEFLIYLKDNANFSNDFEVLIALCEQDRDFFRSEYFRDRKKRIIEAYVLNLKNGRTIHNADNLVIVGSPYAMLMHSVGLNALDDPTFNIEEGTIQCYTERFEDGEYLAEFRSPFNSKNNMGYVHNVYHEYLQKYFNFGKQIIAINMVGTDFQDRNNGSDQDSDSIYTTNQPDIVKCARKCYLEYPTIVNNIPKEKNSYNNTLFNYANIDNNLAAAQRAIGESSNLAQLCLTYTYSFPEDQKYSDYVCILSVLAQVAIDNAKRRFDIDLTEEIDSIKRDMNIKENKYPEFWLAIRKGFNKKAEMLEKEYLNFKNKDSVPAIYKDMYENSEKTKEEILEDILKKYSNTNKINKTLECPMNYIYNLELSKYKSKESTIPMSTFFVKYKLNEHRRKSKAVEELIQKYSFDLLSYQAESSDDTLDDYLLLRGDFDDLVSDIKSVYISKNYLGLMSWLINRAFGVGAGVRRNNCNIQRNTDNNKSILLKVLYHINPDALLKCFAGNIGKNLDT